MNKHTEQQKQEAAESLGFASMELALEYFKQKMLAGGLYESLNAAAAARAAIAKATS